MLLECVQNPQHAVTLDVLELGLGSQAGVSGEQNMVASLRKRQSESVRQRQPWLALTIGLGEREAVAIEDEYAKAERLQSWPIPSSQLALVENVRYSQFEWQPENGLQDPAALEIDQN